MTTDERLNVDDILSVAHAIVRKLYPYRAEDTTPTIRALAADYIRLRSATPAAPALTALLEQLPLVRAQVRPLDCGHHYCRYCDAGTSNHWQHIESCPYQDSVRGVEAAKRIIDGLAAFAPSRATEGQ